MNFRLDFCFELDDWKDEDRVVVVKACQIEDKITTALEVLMSVLLDHVDLLSGSSGWGLV